MLEIRENEPDEFLLLDDWVSLEECNHMVWAFEYDGSAVLWGNVKKGEKHFPRKMTDWLVDRTARAGPYLYMIRDRVNEEVIKKYNLPYMFNADSYLDAIVDSEIPGDDGNWWEYYTSILFLNDNYLGGDLIFPKRELKVTPRMGTLLIFPSDEPWEFSLVQGNAYHIIHKFTDVAAHREDDPAHSRKPFGIKLEPTTGITQRSTKRKGCSKCVKKKSITKANPKPNKIII